MASSGNSQQSSSAAGCTPHPSPSVPSPANSSNNNIKCEQYESPSPRSENIIRPNIMEENSNKITLENNMAGRDGAASSASSSSVPRQNSEIVDGNENSPLESPNFERTSKKPNKNHITDDSNGKTPTDKSNTFSFNVKVKVEPEFTNNLDHIKKEENDIAPTSPVGFGSIGDSMDGAGGTLVPVKEEKCTSNKNVSIGSDGIASSGLNDITSNDIYGASAANSFNKTGGNGPAPTRNCMDAMQQPRLFIFSTQMANRGAESVLNGQFPNIIAFHYAQPATKSFCDDFFVKNPKMKMTNLQHQNTLNMMISGSGSNAMSKITQKSNDGKINSGNKMSRSTNNAAFDESADDLSSENELIKMLDGVESGGGSKRSLDIPAIGAVDSASGDCTIPSLQGVKVPDENLTPQQRQHREEQLAKLKKMNQFLFPDSGNVIPGGISSEKGLNSQTENPLNPAVRNIPPNIMGPNKRTDKITPGLSDNANIPSDIMDNIMRPGGILPNSPEVVMGRLNKDCVDVNLGNADADQSTKVGDGEMHLQDTNQMGMEWSKLQFQMFGGHLKDNNSSTDSTCSSAPTVCLPNSIGPGENVRSNTADGSCATSAEGASHLLRSSSAHGLPPPYHSVQRCASVPIATQSTNPASPNNASSNMSLPSPRTPIRILPATTTVVTTTITATINNTNANINAQTKISLQLEGSPSSSSGNNVNTSRNSGTHCQQNSNPSTPISHMSPKDLESFNITNSTSANSKNLCPSPQRSRTPLEPTDGRLPATSPVLNFLANNQNMSNASSKTLNSMERHRTDNVPLNPNSNRPVQNKLSHAIDPISSLAQMSQQLTSSAPLNIGVSTGGGMGMIGPIDSKTASNAYQNIENVLSLDDGIDPGNQVGAGIAIGMGMMPTQMSAAGQFMPNSSQLNPMFGPMGQRMLNPKLGMDSGPGGNGIGLREGGGPGGQFHAGMPPSQHMMNRMSVNNIQVKSSTPNTIQYMPIRPQNNNANPNMRAQPSLEFLQRYAHPQMAAGALNMMDNSGHMGHHGNAANSGDPNKSTNNANSANSAMDFFQSHNRMGAMNREDMPSVSGGYMMPNHEMNLGGGHPSLIRGLRPNMGPGSFNPAGRMQGSGGNLSGSIMSHNTAASMFGSGGGAETADGPSQMYAMGQQKNPNLKGIGAQNMNAPSAGNSGQMHGGSMPSSSPGAPVFLGPNSNIMQNPKYAQQYQSFQQQLYATSTRGHQQLQQQQHPQGGGGNPNIGVNPNLNPSYFVNK